MYCLRDVASILTRQDFLRLSRSQFRLSFSRHGSWGRTEVHDNSEGRVATSHRELGSDGAVEDDVLALVVEGTALGHPNVSRFGSS